MALMLQSVQTTLCLLEIFNCTSDCYISKSKSVISLFSVSW